MPTVITVEQQSPTHSSSRSSYTTEGSSEGTGVHVSPTAASQEDSDAQDEGWSPVYSEDIAPSESASRPRTSQQYRASSQPPAARRTPTRRHTTAARVSHRSVRAHRQAAPRAPSSVETFEDYPGYGRGYPVQYGPRPPPPAGYPQSFVSGYAPNPFGATGPIVPFGGPAPYGYTNPFSPAPGGGGAGYFPHPQGPPAPGYGGHGHDVMPYGQAPGYPIPAGYGMPPGIPYYPQYMVPSPESSTAATDPEVDKKIAKLEKLMQESKLELEKRVAADKKAEDDAAHKIETDKKIAAEIAVVKARVEAESLANEKKRADEAAAKVEAEKKLAAEIKARVEAESLAKEKKKADEAAAKAAAEKKFEDEVAVVKAKVEADLKAKAEKDAKDKADAAAKASPEKKLPIKFKDAVGRKFSFPFHLCQTWAGMEELIRQAFLHVDILGPHVADGHYDLIGPNGEIILPQVWNTMIEPDWSITMHMWPMPEQKQIEPDANIIHAHPPNGHIRSRSKLRHGGRRPGADPRQNRGPPGPPPPPPGWIGPPPVPNAPGGLPPGVFLVEEDVPPPKKKKDKSSSGFFGLGAKKSAGKGRPKK